jgi:LacI family transcriptional regulator
MSQSKRIALLMGQDLSFCRDVMRGIRAYALQSNLDWIFRNGPAELQIVPYLRDWRPHGMIVHLYLPEVARQVLKLRKPVVDLACTLKGLKMQMVDVDHRAVGRLAAEHLLQQGFTRFGFFGSESSWYSKLREESFRECLAEAGYEVSACYGEYVHHLPTTTSWRVIDRQIHQWLRRFQKPAAIFTSNDIIARNLADICGRMGFRVPGDVAILGVDDDEVECLLASPSLSSIAIPAERIGFEAAQLLDRMMSGNKVSKEPLFLPPVRVITRQSTDMLAVDDSAVAAALAFMRQHIQEELDVAKIVEETGITRRELERRFRARLGCSILEELRRARVELAKGLLSDTQLLMPTIARNAGFSNAQRMAVVFHQMTGQTPTAYRKQARIDKNRPREG